MIDWAVDLGQAGQVRALAYSVPFQSNPMQSERKPTRSAWQRLALAASGADVTHGVARRVGALLGINVPSVLAGGSNGASDGSRQGRKGAGCGGGARAAMCV